MTQALTTAYEFSQDYKKRIFGILVVACIFSVCAYVFLLQKAIVNVVQRQQLVSESRALAIEVSELEEQYFSLKNKITLDVAHSKGLKDAGSISYISKKSVTAMAVRHEF